MENKKWRCKYIRRSVVIEKTENVIDPTCFYLKSIQAHVFYLKMFESTCFVQILVESACFAMTIIQN